MNLAEKIPTDARFIEVECKDCSNKQIIFLKPATKVNCLACGSTLANPTGGKADIKGVVVGVVDDGKNQ
ncbi:MAG: 30S ribosomal protein S27e [Thermoplasmata archaeon]|nr:30S ribosomal protein S27e [Thermoplasmata archaeon]